MRKSTDGASRVGETARTSRTRMSPATRLNRRAVATARSAQAWIGRHAASPATSLRAGIAAVLHPLATAERALPLAVATIVAPCIPRSIVEPSRKKIDSMWNGL